MNTPLVFFNPFAEIRETANYLPHWQQPCATYFATFRLADSIPTDVLAQWRAERATWMEGHPPPWSAEMEAEYHRQFSPQLDAWMNAGAGECQLRDSVLRQHLVELFRYGDGDLYALHAWVIMPNHARVLFSLKSGQVLKKKGNDGQLKGP